MKKTVTGRHRQVSWADTFAYALPALSLAVIGIPVYVYLPKFYTDTIGVNISTVLVGVKEPTHRFPAASK